MSSEIINAWTDHPVTQLGDELGQFGPVRPCTVISYDGDRYCKVIIEGVNLTISRNYVYTEPGRFHLAQPVPRIALERLPRIR